MESWLTTQDPVSDDASSGPEEFAAGGEKDGGNSEATTHGGPNDGKATRN